MSSWGWGSKFLNFKAVNDFSIFGSKSSPFYFTSRWEAFFCEKLKKEEPSFFLIFFAFCRYCADCSSKLPYIRVFLKKFDGFEFWCGLIFNQLKHTPAQVYLLIPQRDSAKQISKEVQSAAKPPAKRSEANELPSEARLKGNSNHNV